MRFRELLIYGRTVQGSTEVQGPRSSFSGEIAISIALNSVRGQRNFSLFSPESWLQMNAHYSSEFSTPLVLLPLTITSYLVAFFGENAAEIVSK